MSTIAVIGMGLLGRGFAENLLAKGHTVRVWNRTASKAEPVIAAGAVGATSPADAVAGADRVHLILAADAAVDSVIAQLRPQLADGAYIVDHSTNLPSAVAMRHATLGADGVRYVHAPVFMGPKNSRDATGMMLISGPTDDIETLRPALQDMTGKLLEFDGPAEMAAAFKINGNGLLIALAGVLGDLFALGSQTGLSPEHIVGLLEQFPVTPAAMAKRLISSGSRPASFELSMARKDVGLMIDSTGSEGVLTMLPAIAERMDALIEAGLGSEDFTIFARPE